MWISLLIVSLAVINYSSSESTTLVVPVTKQTEISIAQSTRVPTNTSMVMALPTDPLAHKKQIGDNILFQCNYPNPSDDATLIRYWVFKLGKPVNASSTPQDHECVNLTGASNLTAYQYPYTLGPLGKNLSISNLTSNQSGRYWCVSSNLDYQLAAFWDVDVYQMSSYLVESIVLLVINGVLFLVFIFCSVYTYWKNRRYVVRHKRLDAANSSTERSADTAESVPRA